MFVRGTSFAGNHALSADTVFLSTGDDSKVCIWSLNSLKHQYQEVLEKKQENSGPIFKNYTPRASYQSKTALLGCDSNWGEDVFATAGAVV